MMIRQLHWEGQLCMRLKTDVDNTGRETQEYNMRPEREAALMPSLKWWSESRIKKTGTRPKEGGFSIALGGGGGGGGCGCGDAHSRSSNSLERALGS